MVTKATIIRLWLRFSADTFQVAAAGEPGRQLPGPESCPRRLTQRARGIGLSLLDRILPSGVLQIALNDVPSATGHRSDELPPGLMSPIGMVSRPVTRLRSRAAPLPWFRRT
jgi:hypothetical protein